MCGSLYGTRRLIHLPAEKFSEEMGQLQGLGNLRGLSRWRQGAESQEKLKKKNQQGQGRLFHIDPHSTHPVH